MKLRARLIVLASLLGFGWLAGCNGTVTTASSPVTSGDIIGVWQNIDPNTSGIAQLQIHLRDSGVGTVVHVYGACSPTLCDWGEATLNRVRARSNGLVGRLVVARQHFGEPDTDVIDSRWPPPGPVVHQL